ncbi:MAG: protease complex subunit PrcB family protein [Gemmatimonadetes bacterium]|nr:protease complex subunit PrcB family protein [Gemmatimonadota bacterium]
MTRRLPCVLAALAALGCIRAEDRPTASDTRPDTVVYAQIDTTGVQVPPGLAEFCGPGTASLRQAGAPPPGADDPGEPLSATDLYRQKSSGLDQPVRCVVRRPEDWAALWAAIRRRSRESPPTPPPAVDFHTRMVLVAGMGPRPSTGYGIGITEVRRTESGIVATVLRYTPGLCVLGMAVTEPVHAVSIPRADAPVQFIEKVSYGPDCLR